MNDESDRVWKREEIASPCIKICVIQPESRLCTGCHRSIEEITAWSRMSPAARETVIAELPGREGVLRKRRGGRAGRIGKG